ncbi:holin family protein [Celeribacter sp.]|uniref:holin family protein n=1 Tax=Celeribacter sp. TaxID=1890673 RepID=UPI003A8E769B
MGMINGLLTLLFGGGRNVLRETAEVFMENSESAAARELAYRTAALDQFAAEFTMPQRGKFDRFMDGLNRVPRPLMAFGTIGLCVAAMVDPIWFAERMQGIALVPEPLWWLLGAIVSFYFGARHQFKTQEFQRSVAETMAAVPTISANISALDALRALDQGARVVESAAPSSPPASRSTAPATRTAPVMSRARVEAEMRSGANPALKAWMEAADE